MIEMPTSKGYMTLLSDADRELTQHRWYALVQEPWGVYVVRMVNRRHVRLHREVMARALGRPLEDGEEVAHINHNRLDNRRENLRLADHAQNCANRKRPSNNTSGYKGVHMQNGRWAARCMKDGARYFLGYFDDPAEAGRAYDAKAMELHGEFAYLNFPEEWTLPAPVEELVEVAA